MRNQFFLTTTPLSIALAMLLMGFTTTAQAEPPEVVTTSHQMLGPPLLGPPLLGCQSGSCDSCDSCDSSPGACGCASGQCGPKKYCVASVEKKTVEKHCWNTKTEDICIPKVILPWQKGGSGLTLFSLFRKCGANGKNAGCDTGCASGCAGGCDSGCCDSTSGCCLNPCAAKVITVCDLEKEKYETKKCVPKFEVKDAGCCD